MNAEKQNRKLDDKVFNEISPLISVQKEEKLLYNHLLCEVTENVIQKLQNDDLFKNLYRNLEYVGSFYKQIRVGKPEEFDINVILKLPNIDKAFIEKGHPGFARIKFRKEDLSSQWTDNKVLKNWLDAKNYLNHDQVRRWFESMSQKSLGTLEKSLTNNGYFILPSKLSSPFEIKIRKSGPAFTLCVIYESRRFDVDLVPVLKFENNPPLSLKEKYRNFQESWYLVPKLLKDEKDADRNWRYSFYKHEKKILKDFGKIKPVIRIIKKIRDVHGWSIIASYYVESLFYQILDSTLDSIHIQNSTQMYITVFMLKKLQESLHQRKLCYFWDPTLNLLQDLNESQTVGIVKRLETIIKHTESQPNNLYNYVFTTAELQEFKVSNQISGVSTPSASGSLNGFLSSSLNGITKLSLQKKPPTNKIEKTIPKPSQSSEKSEITMLQNSIDFLIKEVKELKTKVETIEKKIDAMNQNRNLTFLN